MSPPARTGTAPLSCGDDGACHGPDPRQNLLRIRRGADNAALIESAIERNRGGMGFLSAHVDARDVADIAAWLGAVVNGTVALAPVDATPVAPPTQGGGTTTGTGGTVQPAEEALSIAPPFNAGYGGCSTATGGQVDGGALDGSTLRTSYRHYRDDWGVCAHTASFEWVRPLQGGWSVAPLARFHTQSAARFRYDPVYDPVLGEPFPPGFLAQPAASRTSDTRLSAFGAATLGVRIEAALPAGWHAELRMEWYRQNGDWRVGGTGSPGLPPLDARIVQAGLRRTF